MKILNFKTLDVVGDAALNTSIFSYVVRKFPIVDCVMFGVTFPLFKKKGLRFGVHRFIQGELRYTVWGWGK